MFGPEYCKIQTVFKRDLLGKPAVDLFDRRGDRIITKIKVKDFVDLTRKGGHVALPTNH